MKQMVDVFTGRGEKWDRGPGRAEFQTLQVTLFLNLDDDSVSSTTWFGSSCYSDSQGYDLILDTAVCV